MYYFLILTFEYLRTVFRGVISPNFTKLAACCYDILNFNVFNFSIQARAQRETRPSPLMESFCIAILHSSFHRQPTSFQLWKKEKTFSKARSKISNHAAFVQNSLYLQTWTIFCKIDNQQRYLTKYQQCQTHDEFQKQVFLEATQT